MARIPQQQPAREIRAETRHDAIEIYRKFGLAKQQLEAAERIHRRRDLAGVLAQQIRELAQNAVHFPELFFAQADQFVIEIDGFERLHKQRVPAAAGAVNDPVRLALLARHHRHHETIVADRDEVFLQRAVLAMRPQEAFKRDLNLLLLLLDIPAQTVERDT